jgi:hypothetical protein
VNRVISFSKRIPLVYDLRLSLCHSPFFFKTNSTKMTFFLFTLLLGAQHRDQAGTGQIEHYYHHDPGVSSLSISMETYHGSKLQTTTHAGGLYTVMPKLNDDSMKLKHNGMQESILFERLIKLEEVTIFQPIFQ